MVNHLPQRQCGAFYVDHIQLGAFVVCKILSESTTLIMPTTIQPVIIENSVQFSGLGLSQDQKNLLTEKLTNGALVTPTPGQK